MSCNSHQSWVVFLVARGVAATLFLAVLLGACSDKSDSQAPTTEVAFRFGIRGDDSGSQDFVALTTDAGIISLARSQLALPVSERTLHINGRIERGSGGHNLSWGWHFVPGAWTLTGSSAEVCDGEPQAVEDDLDYWVDKLQSFCPWDAYVKEEVSEPQED